MCSQRVLHIDSRTSSMSNYGGTASYMDLVYKWTRMNGRHCKLPARGAGEAYLNLNPPWSSVHSCLHCSYMHVPSRKNSVLQQLPGLQNTQTHVVAWRSYSSPRVRAAIVRFGECSGAQSPSAPSKISFGLLHLDLARWQESRAQHHLFVGARAAGTAAAKLA